MAQKAQMATIWGHMATTWPRWPGSLDCAGGVRLLTAPSEAATKRQNWDFDFVTTEALHLL
jgi:hypothetical protein